jgi:hypothetical protein
MAVAEPDPSRALAATVSSAQPEDLILVTGSHYLIGPILDTVQPAETSADP